MKHVSEGGKFKLEWKWQQVTATEFAQTKVSHRFYYWFYYNTYEDALQYAKEYVEPKFLLENEWPVDWKITPIP